MFNQQLRKRRLTNTPTDASQVRCNCGLSLNSPEGRGSVAGLKTFFNNSEENQSQLTGSSKNAMLVYVISKTGSPLMPCKPAKAKKLLKKGLAKVVRRTPFTIQLNWITEEQTQDVVLGVDTGYKHVGLSAISGAKELFSTEAEFKTAFIKEKVGNKVIKREVDAIVKNLSERLQYRRTRRNRLWHRKERRDNRGNKKKGWIPPSVKHKLDSHIKLVNFVKSILPVSLVNVEVAAFDIQKIKNPEISGTDYQNGEQKGFWNVREYVLYRDNHTCQHCGKSKDTVLNVHHIESRRTGGDRPDNLITLCEKCHKDYHRGKIELPVKKNNGFKAETLMSIIRWNLVDRLRELGDIVNITYGYITKSARIALGLSKSHINDAFVIAGGDKQKRAYIIQGTYTKRNNRSLEMFYDAKYIDSRNGKAKSGKDLCLIKSKKTVIENLRIYRQQKISKGRRSIRRQRYKFQPNDIVALKNLIYTVIGAHGYGKVIRLKDAFKNLINTNIKNVKLIKYSKGLQFNF